MIGIPYRRAHTVGLKSFSEQVPEIKLNTKISPKAVIVQVSNCLPNLLWAQINLEAQGFLIIENTLYQDNQSAIKIKK